MITTIFQKQDPGTKSKTNRNVDKGTSELKSAKHWTVIMPILPYTAWNNFCVSVDNFCQMKTNGYGQFLSILGNGNLHLQIHKRQIKSAVLFETQHLVTQSYSPF